MRIVNNSNLEDRGRKTRGWLMIIIGCITAFYFATVMLQSSFDWGLFIPLLAALLLVIAGNIKLKQPVVTLPGKNTMIKKLGYFLLSLVLLSFIVVEGLIINSAVASPASQADYLLVLGAGIRGEQIKPLLQQRLDCAINYLITHPDCTAILSGGQGHGESISEAEAMQRYLVQHGIAESRIIKEEKATSTFENLSYTKAILAKQGSAEKAGLVVVTNDFHLFRTTLLAQRLGLNATGLPCRTALIDIPHCYVREYFAVIKSLALDKN